MRNKPYERLHPCPWQTKPRAERKGDEKSKNCRAMNDRQRAVTTAVLVVNNNKKTGPISNHTGMPVENRRNAKHYYFFNVNHVALNQKKKEKKTFVL